MKVFRITYILVSIFVVLFFWAAYSQIDQSVRATGTVIASNRSQIVQVIDGGVLDQLNVHEGAHVKKGEVIAKLNDIKVKSSLNEAAIKADTLKLTSIRLQAEFMGKPFMIPKGLALPKDVIDGQKELYAQRKSSIDSELQSLKTAKNYAFEEMTMLQKLVATGDANRAELLKAQRATNEADAAYLNRLNKYRQDVQSESSKAEEDLAQLNEVIAERREQLTNTQIRSPMAGIVKNVKFTTLGAVLKPGEELLQIVPLDDKLIIEAKITPKDIGDIKIGLPASIKFDTFDSSIFGSVDGRVSYLSPDSLTEQTAKGEMSYFRAQLETPDGKSVTRTGKRLDITPGMTVTIDIKTGKRSLLKYLLKPLMKTFSESLNEK